jgi:Zn-dependent peptidase ImmA (M78 family)
VTDYLTRRVVEKAAAKLLARMGIVKPPVDVERIARRLKYRVVFEHFPGDLSATLIRDATNSITIGINSYHPRVRQRFSIAHEIGHGELHVRANGRSGTVVFVDPPGVQVLFRDDAASLGDDPREIQANQFAAALLMPRDFIADSARRILVRASELGESDFVERLATRFEVSQQAMRYRLVNLGVLEPD